MTAEVLFRSMCFSGAPPVQAESQLSLWSPTLLSPTVLCRGPICIGGHPRALVEAQLSLWSSNCPLGAPAVPLKPQLSLWSPTFLHGVPPVWLEFFFCWVVIGEALLRSMCSEAPPICAESQLSLWSPTLLSPTVLYRGPICIGGHLRALVETQMSL